MYEFRLAYRHGNGEVEGFVGVGSTTATARRAAVNKATAKAAVTGTAFDPARLVERAAGLSADELKLVREDWTISARSATL